MKKGFNKKLCLAAAALTLTAGVSVGSAMAYFTTYATTSGGAVISLGSTTIIPDEEVSAMTKHISVQNTGDYECFVRVKVLAGDKYKDGLVFTPDAEGHWTENKEDGYFYCDQVIQPGQASSRFDVKIDTMGSEQDFNVIVVQECTAALYDENGKAYADWSRIADTSSGEYNGEGGGN